MLRKQFPAKGERQKLCEVASFPCGTMQDDEPLPLPLSLPHLVSLFRCLLSGHTQAVAHTQTHTHTRVYEHMLISTLGANRFLFPAFFTWLLPPLLSVCLTPSAFLLPPSTLLCLASYLAFVHFWHLLLLFVLLLSNDFSLRQQENSAKTRRVFLWHFQQNGRK